MTTTFGIALALVACTGLRGGWVAGQAPKSQEPAASPAPNAPPARKPIAGLAGFDCVSRLTYASEPDRPHRLRTTYAFPDRVRWQVSLPGAGDDSAIQYRHGEGCFRIAAGGRASEACTGTERAEMLLHMELRRAIWLYPDGFAWEGEGLERRADLGELGSLFARTGSASGARPTEIGDIGPDGKTIDVYKQIAWREQEGRTWPASLELWHVKGLAWSETVESIDIAGRFIDVFFLPPDRRPAQDTQAVVDNTRSMDLPASCSLRIEIPKGTSWEDVVAGYSRHAAEWDRRLSDAHLALDKHATVEISEVGEPVAWILRLATVPEHPPEGFALVATRKGIALAVRGLGGISADRLAALRKSVAQGSSTGAPYVRFDPGASPGGTVLVVLPYNTAPRHS